MGCGHFEAVVMVKEGGVGTGMEMVMGRISILYRFLCDQWNSRRSCKYMYGASISASVSHGSRAWGTGPPALSCLKISALLVNVGVSASC